MIIIIIEKEEKRKTKKINGCMVVYD